MPRNSGMFELLRERDLFICNLRFAFGSEIFELD